MKYHNSSGVWKRCRAHKRPGHGVTQCPLNLKEHVNGRHGIAATGGGVIERVVAGKVTNTVISSIHNGRFTARSDQGFVRVYRANGTVFTLRDRARYGDAIEDEEIVDETPSDPMAALRSQAPRVLQLFKFDEKEWLAIPWAERKTLIDIASIETRDFVKNMKDEDGDRTFYTVGGYGGWMRSKRNLGHNKKSFDGRINVVELSDVALRYRSPREITNTIVHEYAHSVSSFHADHGPEFHKNFRKILDAMGLEDMETSNHASKMTDAEKEEQWRIYKQQLAAKKLNANRYHAICPSDSSHIHYSAGMKRSTYGCTMGDCKNKPFAERTLKFEKNPDWKKA